MRLPQIITVLVCLIIGGLWSNVKQDVPLEAAAFSSTKASSQALADLFPSDSASDKCACGDGCQCKASELKELQAKYDDLQSKLKATEAAYTIGSKLKTSTASTGYGSTGSKAVVSSGGSTGKATYSTVVETKTASGGSTGNAVKHPVANVVKGVATAAKNTAVGVAKVATAPVRNYRARWTHPGDIETHMQVEHGVSVSGLSQDQLLMQHDAIHDAIGPVYSTASYSQTVSNSSCPGGVCPSRTAYRTSGPIRRLLGR